MARVEAERVGLGAVAPDGLRAQPRRPHEARDAPSAHHPAGGLEQPLNPRAPVPLSVLNEEPRDLGGQSPVLLRMRAHAAAPPGVEAGGRHRVAPAERRDAVVRALGLDEGEEVALRAEQNRMAFLRSSCSSCSAAYFAPSACSWAISRAGPRSPSADGGRGACRRRRRARRHPPGTTSRCSPRPPRRRPAGSGRNPPARSLTEGCGHLTPIRQNRLTPKPCVPRSLTRKRRPGRRRRNRVRARALKHRVPRPAPNAAGARSLSRAAGGTRGHVPPKRSHPSEWTGWRAGTEP